MKKEEKEKQLKERYEETERIAKKCKRRSEFQEKYKTEYHWAWRHGLLEKFCVHMPEKHQDCVWTFEKLKNAASKFKKRGEFQKNNFLAYILAYNRGILDDVCSHMPKPRSWINKIPKQKEILEIALSYPKISEFAKENMGAYYAAKRHGIYETIKEEHKAHFGDTSER